MSSELDSELVVEEQRAFLDWQCAPQRIAHLSEIAQTCFEGYDWPGNLREFEALMQRLIDAQCATDFDGAAIEETCARFRAGVGATPAQVSACYCFGDDLERLAH